MSNSFYKIGGMGTNDPSTVLQFQAMFSGGLTRVSHLRLPFQTTGYQVTPGKTLYITKIFDSDFNFNPSNFHFGYCDNDVGFDTATARVNAVMAIGGDLLSNRGLVVFDQGGVPGNDATLGDTYCNLFPIAISEKFPYVRRVATVAGGTLLLWGIEF